MIRCSLPTTFTVLSMLLLAGPAMADTMRCQSINGNLNCAGSGGVSCQTVNGKKVCVSGHGDVVQSFGGNGSADDNADEEDLEAMPPAPGPKDRIERRGPGRHSLLLERDGTRLHLRSDWLSIDRE